MHPVLVLLITLSYLVQGVQGHGQAKHLNHHGDKRIGETAEMQRTWRNFIAVRSSVFLTNSQKQVIFSDCNEGKLCVTR